MERNTLRPVWAAGSHLHLQLCAVDATAVGYIAFSRY